VLPFYTEIEVLLDANGNGVLDFSNKPVPTYGTASVTLSTTGGMSGAGSVYIGNNLLGPIALAQGFGPFNVPPLGTVKINITGGPTNGIVKGILQGACYLPSEQTPAQNLQFSTPDVQSSSVLVYETNVSSGNQLRFGPFSTLQFTALALRIFGGPDFYTAGLDWFSDQEMTQETGSTEWTGDQEIEAISDVWSNLGPWVRLTLTPHHSGCGMEPDWTLISLAPVASDAVSLEHTAGIILNMEGTVSDGGDQIGASTLVLTGAAVLSITTSEAKPWELDLSWVDSAGSAHTFIKIQSDQEGWAQGIALPGYPIVATFTNDAGDASDQSMTVNIIKSPKGSGTPGQPGPSGGGSAGVTSFDTRTGAVVFELTDIPNPLSAPDGAVLTLVGGVATWVGGSPPSFLPFTDDFTRADQNPLVSPWVNQLGSYQVLSDLCQEATDGSIPWAPSVFACFATVDTGVTDYDIQVTTVAVGNNTVGILARYTDASNFLGFTPYDNIVVDLVAGVRTVICATTFTPGDVVEIQVVGTAVTALVNGVVQGTGITANVGTKAGLYGYGPNGAGLVAETSLIQIT
jgi:hypothetical protein